MRADTKFKLIIAEKPDAARRIATALCNRVSISPRRGQLPVYEITRDGGRVIIMAALGHLYTLRQEGKGWDYPVYNMEWVPKFEVDKSARNTKAFIDKFKELSAGAESFIVATDYDVEGETIAYCILKYACGEEALDKAQRMKFSTLTDKELVDSYERPMAHMNLRMAEAGETRHKVDWLFGINISRALILAVKHATGRYRALSTGRVQGPTLTFIADREASIRCFVPTPYWSISAQAEIRGQVYLLEHSKDRIPTKNEAEGIVKKCLSKKGTITEITKKETSNLPPYPFDLGSLQAEAYRLFGYTPSRTLFIAERLYLAALISYPRTSSQKVPDSLNPRAILESLSQIPKYRPLAEELLAKDKLYPNQGKRDDPAHPPITPTGTLPPVNGLSEPENKIYDLVVRRFMSIYGDPAISERIRASVDVNGETFYLRGRKVLHTGWLRFYEPYYRGEEIYLPEIQEGMTLENVKVFSEEKFTNPLPRYNPGTLLKLMEDEEIGTKATRAEIIDTLNRREYVTGDRITITELGFAVVDVLRRYSPQILSVETTRQLEKNMERIQFGEASGPEVILKAIDFLDPVLQKFKVTETAIGATLDEALQRSLRESSTIGPCPVCKLGKLLVIRSRSSGKRFVGCTNYRNGQCRFSAPLPQSGTLQLTERKCQTCGFPIVIVRMRSRRPWNLCVNPKCDRNTRNKPQQPIGERSADKC